MIALVPARGGSKGIPRKNLLPLRGMPLICHTLEQARRAKRITRILVSTDDEEIAACARTVDMVEVPFLRPAPLSTDSALAVDAYLHAADWLASHEASAPAAFCVLLPTSPLRLPSDIDESIDLFDRRSAASVVSVTVAKPKSWHLSLDDQSRISTSEGQIMANRQELPRTVVPNGSIYVLDITSLRKTRSYFGSDSFGYLMPADRSVDIDDAGDLRLAEALLSLR